MVIVLWDPKHTKIICVWKAALCKHTIYYVDFHRRNLSHNMYISEEKFKSINQYISNKLQNIHVKSNEPLEAPHYSKEQRHPGHLVCSFSNLKYAILSCSEVTFSNPHSIWKSAFRHDFSLIARVLLLTSISISLCNSCLRWRMGPDGTTNYINKKLLQQKIMWPISLLQRL